MDWLTGAKRSRSPSVSDFKQMIVVSDNTATNIVLERFSADTVNAFLDTFDPRAR